MGKKVYVLISAAGQGKRMGWTVPKQFMRIAHKPLLYYTLRFLYNILPQASYVLVLPRDYINYWQDFCNAQGHIPLHRCIPGGDTRFISVKKGLHALPHEDAFVFVHDGVRPFVTQELIQRLLTALKDHDGVVPAIRIQDSLRYGTELENKNIINRHKYFCTQTPQAFHLPKLKTVFEQKASTHFTDEASVFETKHKIYIVKGEACNIKITSQEDLKDIASKIANHAK